MRQQRVFAIHLALRVTAAVWLALTARGVWAAAVGDFGLSGRPTVELSIRETTVSARPLSTSPLDRTDRPMGSVLNGGPLRSNEDPPNAVVSSGDWQTSDPSAWPYQRFEGRLSELEVRLFEEAAAGYCLDHSLLAAALVASGVSDLATLRRYEAQVAGLVAELRRSGQVRGSPRQQAQAIFEFMHRRALRGGYQLDCTDLTIVLSEGRFNCVSASVTFNCLAAEFGLVARGLEVPGHALSRLVLPEGNLDVETTCPDWFRLLDNPEKQAELVSRTIGIPRMPGRASEERRQVSDVELVATIYYNRGVDLLGERQFAAAVAANAKALRLDPHSVTARGNLLATLNNWAVAEAGAGCFREAADLLRQGLAIDPNYEMFRNNDRHVYREWIAQLCRVEEFSQAVAVLDRAARDYPEETTFSLARLDVYRLWVRNRFQAGRAEEAQAVLAQARRELGDLAGLREIEAAAPISAR